MIPKPDSPRCYSPVLQQGTASHARAIVVRIKGRANLTRQRAPIGSPYRSIRSSPRIRCRSKNLFFLDRRTADPRINEKIFSLVKTATLFANAALRLLTHAVVRK